MGELPTAATSREAKTVDLVATGTVEVSPEWLHCDGSRWLSSKPLGALNEDMPLTFPGWVKWTLRVVAWAGWQVVVLYFAFVVYANLFTEYGLYSNRFVDPVAAVTEVGGAASQRRGPLRLGP